MKSYAQRRSRLQEKRAAQDVGGREQPGSGATKFAKGDFRAALDVRGECKHTSNRTFILKLDDLMKIREEALLGHLEDPVMQVEFVGQVGQSEKLAVLGWNSLMQLWKTKPAAYIGLVTVNHFQIGKQFILKLDEWIAHKGKGQLTPAYRVTFNQPDDKEIPASNSFALIDWQTYLDLREAVNA